MHQIVEAAGGSRRWTRHRAGRPDPLLACTFCGRPREENRTLIAGPGVFVCKDCAGAAENVISSGMPARTGLAQLTAVPAQDTRARCSFCGKYRHQTPGMAVSTARTERQASAMIRAECVAFCAEISRDELLPRLTAAPKGAACLPAIICGDLAGITGQVYLSTDKVPCPRVVNPGGTATNCVL